MDELGHYSFEKPSGQKKKKIDRQLTNHARSSFDLNDRSELGSLQERESMFDGSRASLIFD